MINMSPSDSVGPSAIANSLEWVSSALTGEVATSLGVLAVAGLGFSMLAGRLPVRRGMTVLVGCFVLFGAPAIANGLFGAARANDGQRAPEPHVAQPPIALPALQQQAVEDPYAGASIIPQRPR